MKKSNISCQEITTRINEIKIERMKLDNFVIQGKFSEGKIQQVEISKLIQKVRVEAGLIFVIEGKEYPTYQLEIGGKTAEELENELISRKIKLSAYAKDMLLNPDFVTSPTTEQINLVKLKVSDLGITNRVIIDEIYAKALELGLELCPAEVGPHQRLIDTNQPMEDNYSIAMKQITGQSDIPIVFSLGRSEFNYWLRVYSAGPTKMWPTDSEFVFQVPNI